MDSGKKILFKCMAGFLLLSGLFVSHQAFAGEWVILTHACPGTDRYDRVLAHCEVLSGNDRCLVTLVPHPLPGQTCDAPDITPRARFEWWRNDPAQYFAVIPNLPLDECEANPCDPVSGKKFQLERDFVSSSNLSFYRYYASLPNFDGNVDLSGHWRHNFSSTMLFGMDTYDSQQQYLPAIRGPQESNEEDACINGWSAISDQAFSGVYSASGAGFNPNNGRCYIAAAPDTTIPVQQSRFTPRPITSSTTFVRYVSKEGHAYFFEKQAGEWRETSNAKVTLTQDGGHWLFVDADKAQDRMDENGHLIERTFIGGEVLSLSYGENGKLQTVASSLGRQIDFHYLETSIAEVRLDYVSTPSGEISFEYDNTNLISVTYQDGTARRYHYEDSRFPSHLTGITNESGDRYASWAYDSSGRVISSEHANGTELYEFVYSSADGTTRVTGPNGDQRTYQVSAQHGGAKVSDISGDRCQTCPNSQYKHRTYDDNGYLASTTDWNGVTTHFVHDDTGLELSRTEAAGTSQERTISTGWHDTLRLPVKVTTPTSVTQFTYDEQGNRLSRTESPR